MYVQEFTLTRRSAQRIQELLSDNESRRPNDRLQRRNDQGGEGSNVQFVQIDSLDKSGEFYLGHWWMYDTINEEFLEQANAWILAPNGSVTLGIFYAAILVGIKSKVPVWSLLDDDEFICAKLDGTSNGNKYGWQGVSPAANGTFTDITGFTGSTTVDTLYEISGAIELTKDRVVLAKRGHFIPSFIKITVRPASVVGVYSSGSGSYSGGAGIGGGPGIDTSTPDGSYGVG